MNPKPKYKRKSIKFLEENIRVNLSDLEFSKRLLDMTPKHE